MEDLFAVKFDFGSANPADGYIKIDENTDYSKELGYGFVYDVNDKGERMINVISDDIGTEPLKRGFCRADKKDVPMRFNVDVPHNGTYNVKVILGSVGADSRVILLSESRRFILNNKQILKDEFIEKEFTVNVCDIHRHGEQRITDNTLNIALMGENACINALEINEVTDAVSIYIAGDSTVTDQTANYPYNPKSTYSGWGQMLGQFLKKGVCVSNHAQSGLTTQTFMDSNWNVVKERIKKGDFLFIQFGHNDQKVESLGAYTGYYDNLKYYIDYVRKAGAVPVVCTPINRIIFEEDGTLKDLLGEYGSAVRKVCRENDVPCIDLLKKTTEYFTAHGDVDAWDYFWGDGTNRDYTHTNDIGAEVIAKFVAQGICENNIKPICDYIDKSAVEVEMPKPKPKTVKRDDNSKELKAIQNIGLVNMPKFTDIKGLENEDIIRELASKGICDSVEESTFGADEDFTEKSAVYWAVVAAGVRDEDKIGFAENKNWISYTPTENPITREKLAALLVNSYNFRAADRAIVGNIDKYSDRDLIDPSMLDFVRAADEMDFLKGISDTEYAPKKTLKRGAAASIFYKMIKTN